LYDVIPSCIALLLLSMGENNHNNALDKPAGVGTTISSEPNEKETSVVGVIRRMALPFTIALIGSVLGCIFWFGLSVWKQQWLLSKEHAAVAVACLVALFVGGSVNFLATAAYIAAQTTSLSSKQPTNTLLSTMATADLVVMAINFALLAAALQSKGLQQWFQGENDNVINSSVSFSNDPGLNEKTVNTTVDQPPFKISNLSAFRRTPATVLVSCMALILVRVGRMFESAVARFVLGTTCAFLASVILVDYFF